MRWLGIVLACAALACEPVPRAEAHDLTVSNQTSLAVTIVVNADPVRTVPPSSQQTMTVRELPPLPWAVEARSPSGRVLGKLSIQLGDVWVRARETSREMKGDALRIDLSCGRLDLWSGPPILGPAPGAGTPGDCAP